MKGTVQLDERPDTAQRTSDRKIRSGGLAQRLNALRAGVLGANDGIVSTAAVVVGVAGATTDAGPILMAGLAAAVGGAVSMALGEYVSVSSQRDSERHLIEQQSQALRNDPEGELLALARSYEERGISAATARRASVALCLSSAAGALLPLLAFLPPCPAPRLRAALGATHLSLALAGAVAAGIGGASRLRSAARVTLGGALALAVSFAIGFFVG